MTVGDGRAWWPCVTKYTGPAKRPGKIGVRALAIPTTDPGGHEAGFASKVLCKQAPWSVVSLVDNCLGKAILI